MDLGSILDQLTQFIVSMSATPWVYVILFVFTTIDGFFPPVPSESIVVSLSALAISTGQPWLIGIYLAGVAGAVLGDNIAYQIGHTVHPGDDRGPRFLRTPRMQKAFSWARKALRQRGAIMILVARHIPVGRVAVNLMAGATGYPRRRFVPLSVVAALLWALYGIGIGTLAGNWAKEQPLLAAALAVVLAMILGYCLDRVVTLINKRRGLDEADTEPTDTSNTGPTDTSNTGPTDDSATGTGADSSSDADAGSGPASGSDSDSDPDATRRR